MAQNTSPVFPLIPQLDFVQFATANTNRDGTGTIADLITGDTDGTKVEWVRIKAQVTTTAGMIRIYIKKSGGSYRLIHEMPVSALTVAASTPAWDDTWTPREPLILESGDILAVSTHNAETFNAWGMSGDFS